MSTTRKQQIDGKWEVTGAELLGKEDEEMEKKNNKESEKECGTVIHYTKLTENVAW